MITVLIAIGAFILVLGVLVVVHELGHYWTARAFRIKVLEFGFGYPPRLFGIRTGRTRVRVDDDTYFHQYEEDATGLRVGDFVKLWTVEDEHRELLAKTVVIYRSGVPKGKAANITDTTRLDDLKTEGFVKGIEGDDANRGRYALLHKPAPLRRVRPTGRREQPQGPSQLGWVKAWGRVSSCWPLGPS